MTRHEFFAHFAGNLWRFTLFAIGIVVFLNGVAMYYGSR